MLPCRNLHQLLTLVYPDRQREMLRSMTGMYEEWGCLQSSFKDSDV